MPLVGQRVPDRYFRMTPQGLHRRLTIRSISNAVIQPSQNPRRVLKRFQLPHMKAGGVKVGDPRALMGSGNFESAPGTGRGLLEDQCNDPTDQPRPFPPGPASDFQPPSQSQQAP